MKKITLYIASMVTFLGLLTVRSYAATTYYVSTGGNDANSGTQTSPWSTVQKAAGTMSAGDTVIVTAGNYPTQRVKVTRSGSAGSPITFQAQGTVTMKGFTVQASYVNIKGFEISVGTDNGTEGVGIDSTGNNNLIENNILHDCAWGGITIGGTSSNSVARNNKAYHNGQIGIQVFGTNNLVEGNEVSDSLQYYPGVNAPSWADADGMRFFGSGHTFRKNYIHDIKFDPVYNINPHIDCFQTWTDANHTGGTNILFEQNLCDNLQSHALRETGSGFMLAQASNITIRNNIIKTYVGLNCGGGDVSYLNIYNNVWIGDMSFDTSYYPFGVDVTGVPYAKVKNNIFYNQPLHSLRSTGTPPAGQEIDYNLYFNVKSDGTSACTSSTCCLVVGDYVCSSAPHDKLRVNPLFVNPSKNDFRLQAPSPAINTGVTVAGVVNDYAGTSRPQGSAFDIGPYEYTGSTPVPTTTPAPTPQPTATPVPTPTPTPAPKPGDINHDGLVNSVDMQMVLSAWGSVTGSVANLNGDGLVNSLDATIVIANWTQ